MDPLFCTKIATNIHAYCAKITTTPETYTEDPVRFRQNMENCFLNVMDQYHEVMKGVEVFWKTYPPK